MEIIVTLAAMVAGAAIVYFLLSRQIASERAANQVMADQMRDAENHQNQILREGFERELNIHINSINHLRAEKEQLSTSVAELKKQLDSQKEQDFRRIATLEKERGELLAKLESAEDSQKKMKESFEDIARRVLEEKSGQINTMNRERLSQILEPLSKDIDGFKRQIEGMYLGQTKQSVALSSELRQLMELNKQLSDDAISLTKALRGEHNPKMQGDWGEMILDSVLSGSGLKNGEHYFMQESQKDDNGRLLRPDVIVRYPDGREVIIDSKVSLTAYARYIDAQDDVQKELALKEHLLSVRRHIDTLSAKEYHKRDAACDFVMMFMPVEPAYMLALSGDTSLWEYAYKRKIVLVSPTHLVTALKLVYDLWSRYDQSQNALKIASRGAELYDKFAGFVGDMTQLGKSLDSTRKQYDGAMNKLSSGRGNLLRQAEMLKELGVRASKEIKLESNDQYLGNEES